MLRLLLHLQMFIGVTIGYVYRFFATICFGEEQALRRAQQAVVDFYEQNGGMDVMRMLQSPVRVTMPDRPRQMAPRADFTGVLFDSGPYRITRTWPPDEMRAYWRFDFEGPGFEGGHWGFIGVTEECGASNIGGLALAYATGKVDALREVEAACPTQ